MIRRIKNFFHHYLLPHESNNYKARMLHHPFLILYILFFLVFQLSYSYLKKTDSNILGYATNITLEKILDLVNQERAKNSLSPLTLSKELTEAANKKAADMFNKNYWAHISPTGTTPWEFITGSGYQYIYAGENLAKSFDTSDEVVKAWMNSPTHRANIMKGEYSEIGLAVVNGVLLGEETTLVVQEFGSRTTPQTIAYNQKNSNPLPTAASEKPASQVRIASITIEKAPSVKWSKTVSLIVAEILLIVLLFDSIYIWRTKTERLAGHSLAHILFILALIGAMSVAGIGVVL